MRAGVSLSFRQIPFRFVQRHTGKKEKGEENEKKRSFPSIVFDNPIRGQGLYCILAQEEKGKKKKKKKGKRKRLTRMNGILARCDRHTRVRRPPGQGRRGKKGGGKGLRSLLYISRIVLWGVNPGRKKLARRAV